ncbi:NTTRR-F1 domain [Bacillus wiedmannii]|uniref:NTTRR-F1 domain n=1 Tax=Bacillus wiedmannii TaxID=1890302 RepID=UPI00115C7381|nr:NTTRR-F1 domain [Bacillus wiedmannii]
MIKNRIVNGGFETGTLSPFIVNNPSFVSINSSTSHSGVYSAKLSGGLTNAIIAQAVPVSPNETFELFVSISKVGPFPSPLIAINVQYYNGNTFLGDGLVTFILSNRIPDNNEKDWLEVYETASPVPATANTASIVIAKFPELGSADVFIDDISLLSVGSTGTSIPETTCFQDTKAKLQHCTGHYVSLVLSGCCTPIQGQISNVDEGSILFISTEGTSAIAICNIVSFTSIPLVYGANLNENTVFIVSTLSNTAVKAPIIVGDSPIDIAITPDGTRAYVVNRGDSTVSVINTITNTVIGTPISVGSFPVAIAITSDGTRAYVVNQGNSTVSVISTITNTVIGTPISVGSTPEDIAITPDGTRAYVINRGDSTVSVISTITNTVIGIPISVGNIPVSIAITPDGTRAYVVNQGDSTVSVISTITNTVIGTPISAGSSPAAIAITPDGTRAYVTIRNDSTVLVINTVTNTVMGFPFSVVTTPEDIAITPNGARAYISYPSIDAISAIDIINDFAIGGSISVGDNPIGIAITPSCI